MKDLYEKYVGQKALVVLEGLKVEVIIVDVKISYGRERYQVEPVSGEGSKWVEKVTLVK